MSFSTEVKRELIQLHTESYDCQLVELVTILNICGRITISELDQFKLKIRTENVTLARKCFTLIKKTFNMETDISILRSTNKKSSIYEVQIKNHEYAIEILRRAHIIDEWNEVIDSTNLISESLIKEQCCKRAFIRTAFLVSGSMSDPTKSYHLEIVCDSEGKAEQLERVINGFELGAKVVQRKKNYVVYLKEGAQIVDMLNIMEAHSALMELENVRILKDMRNSVNRKVNCETANINKTVSAAVKQVNDIMYIRDNLGFDKLSEGLQEVAEVRIKYQDLPLKDLGLMLKEPVGKSGVNHRLRKLGKIAEQLRESLGGSV